MDDKERKFYEDVGADMDDMTATLAIYQLSSYLSRFYERKVIILLDEFGYPPVTIDDVYKEVLEQAENFKKYAN